MKSELPSQMTHRLRNSGISFVVVDSCIYFIQRFSDYDNISRTNIFMACIMLSTLEAVMKLEIKKDINLPLNRK